MKTKSFGIVCYRKRPDGIAEYLLVQRKDSLNYMSFLKGNFETASMERMTRSELLALANLSYAELWQKLWRNHLRSPQPSAQNIHRFNQMKESGMLQSCIDRAMPHAFEDCEWGLPKGRPNKNESGMECALREFREETGYDTALLRVQPYQAVVETYVGTDGVQYVHHYYIAEMVQCSSPPTPPSKSEVSRVGWFSLSDALSFIRPYERERKLQLFSKVKVG